MKRSLMTALAASSMLALATGLSHAADLPDEITPEPAPVVDATTFDWTGFYVGANAGINFFGDFDIQPGPSFNQGVGFIGGGVIGYQKQIDKFVFGVEGDLNAVTGRANPAGLTLNLDFLGTVTAKVGYTPAKRLLTYVEGGYAVAKANASTAAASDSNIHHGFVVGAGVDYAITDKIISGIEYNYVDVQNRTFNLGAPTAADYSGHNVKFNLKYKF